MPVLRRALLLASLLLPAASAALAQDHDTAAGYGAGFLSPGRLNPGAGGTDLALDAGWVLTAFGETWHAAGGRVGARLNGAFTQRPLQVAGESRDISTWMADASLLLRLLPPREGRVVAPFVSGGAGIIHYGLGRGVPSPFPDEGVLYPGDAERQVTLVGGAGLDVVPGGFRAFGTPLGVRLEVADHVALRSPFRTLDGGRLGPIHNLRFGVSLVGLGWF
jgi:hypothetical protein